MDGTSGAGSRKLRINRKAVIGSREEPWAANT